MNTSNLAKKRPFWLSRSIKHCSDWSQSFDWEIILPIYHSRKTYGAVPMKGRSINFDYILCLKLWSLFMMCIEGTVILCIELLCRLNQLSLGVNRPSGSWRFPWPWCRERENSSSCSITLKTLPLFFVYKRLFQGNFSVLSPVLSCQVRTNHQRILRTLRSRRVTHYLQQREYRTRSHGVRRPQSNFKSFLAKPLEPSWQVGIKTETH